jgi:sigma-B regulation protein RsbU (phosphoserine phosphatase)
MDDASGGGDGTRFVTPDRASGMRLDQVMLIAIVVLVVPTVTMSGVLQALATQAEFNASIAAQPTRLEDRVRTVGQGIAQVIAVSSASALRDNDFAFLSNVVGLVVRADSSIRRVRIVDAAGRTLADTGNDKDSTRSAPAGKGADRKWVEVTIKGERALEYQEPIVHEDNVIGTVALTYSTVALEKEIARLEQSRTASQRRILVRTVILAFVFTLIGSVLAALQSRRITRPLASLTVTALKIAQGDLGARVTPPQSAGQEVNLLSQVFNYMAGQIKVLLDETRARALLDEQMQVARTVQESLLPTTQVITAGPLQIAGKVVTAERCGGDFWAVSQLDDQRYSICVGDVIGHGLPTALVAAAACSAFHYGTGFPDIGTYDMMIRFNRTVFQTTNGGHQITCALATINLVDGDVEIANAGHPFPLVFNRVTKNMRSLIAKGPRLGESMQSVFLPYRTKLEAGDVLLFYSDGVTEAEDANGQPYAAKRLRTMLATNGHLPVNELRDLILADVTNHVGTVRDDMTLLVVAYQPEGASA